MRALLAFSLALWPLIAGGAGSDADSEHSPSRFYEVAVHGSAQWIEYNAFSSDAELLSLVTVFVSKHGLSSGVGCVDSEECVAALLLKELLPLARRPYVTDASGYASMQRREYEQRAAGHATDATGDVVDERVVGSFHQQNAWQDYDEYLFRDLGDTRHREALDFGCGPGRNIAKFTARFERVDGVDIAKGNLKNAEHYLTARGLERDVDYRLHLCNGRDLAAIRDASYDVVFSTITLQHIAVHEVRAGYFNEFARVLRPGGAFCSQMGFGRGKPNSVPYHTNHYDAQFTNGKVDARVERPEDLQADLAAAGLVRFRYWIRPAGPGDRHPNWIFFQAFKPPPPFHESPGRSPADG